MAARVAERWAPSNAGRTLHPPPSSPPPALRGAASLLRGRCYTAAEQRALPSRGDTPQTQRWALRGVCVGGWRRRRDTADLGVLPGPRLRPQLLAAQMCAGLQAPLTGLSAAPGALQRISGLSSLVIPALLAIAHNNVGLFRSRSVSFHRLLLPKAARRLVPSWVPAFEGGRAPLPAGRTGPRRADRASARGKEGSSVAARRPCRRAALRQRRARAGNPELAALPSAGARQPGKRPGAASVTHGEGRFFK